MKRMLAPLLTAVVLAALLPGSASAATPTLAVTYFDNNTSEERFDPLGRGLADMLITDLSVVENLTVVERGRLNDVLSELELQSSSFVDPETAVTVGKGVGAQYVLTGAFLAVEPQMRIDARIVNVSTGEVVQADSVTGPVDEFFLLEKELAGSIVERLGISVSSRESARMGRVATENFEAFVAYSEGLAALDRGALDQARDRLAAALEADDRFGLATEHLDGLQEKLRQLGARGAEIRSQYARDILDEIDRLHAAGGPYDELGVRMVEASTKLMGPAASSDAMAVSSRILDLEVDESIRLGGPTGYMTLNEWALSTYVMSTYNLGMRAEFLTYGEAFLDRYPTSTWSSSVRMWMEQVITLMRDEEQGRSQIPRVRGTAAAFAAQMSCTMRRAPDARLAACKSWVLLIDEHKLEADDDAEEGWARAAADAGDIAAIEEVLARAQERDKYSEAAEDISSILDRARRSADKADEALEKLRSGDKGEREGDWYHAASAQVSAGRHQQARELIEEGLKKFPASNMLFRLGVNLGNSTDDLAYAQQMLARWEQAEAQGAKVEPDSARTVREMPDRLAEAAHARGWELFKLATGYSEIKQYELAGDAYVQLAREAPDFDWTAGPQALQQASGIYRMGMAMGKSRAALEELLEKYPDSEQAGFARTMLETLP